MRKNFIIPIFALLVFCNTSFATNTGSSVYNVDQYTLSNGLTVYLNPDHNLPKIFGAVVVRAGSNNESNEATGIAHYFEHIMFKGTDSIGTIDWAKESVLLDSIRLKYDELGNTKDEKKRKEIQQQINQLSVKAAEYAIPNETDKILKHCGGTEVNAYTSFDRTVYHNSFPSSQLENWLHIYYERFRKPVFRLFQSELETVYEEKNMSLDDPYSIIIDTLFSKAFAGHPAGHHTVLGLSEHLKNPSLSKMYEFFDKYYVANNMALVLCGDFDPDKAKVWIEQYFGKLRSGEKNFNKLPKPKGFTGREFYQYKLFPIKVGLLSYHTPESANPDNISIDLINLLLSNNSSTGLLDKLRMDNKILMAGLSPVSFPDAGADIIFFVPKILGQKLPNAEALVKKEIQRVKNGDFPDELLSSLKTEKRRQLLNNKENIHGRANMLIDAFIDGVSYKIKFEEDKIIDTLKKKTIVLIANKYFGDDHLVIYSKTGFPKKTKLEKPAYKPIESKEGEKASVFAKEIYNKEVIIPQPHFIELNKDVVVDSLQSNLAFFHVNNPYNNIFNINIKFQRGVYYDKTLAVAANYMNLIGTENMNFDIFRKELQKLGSDIKIWADEDALCINITGFDENLGQTLLLANELITKPKADEKQLMKCLDEAKLDRKFETSSPDFMGWALQQYVLYGKKSDYLNRLSLKEIKKLTSAQLLASFHEAMKYQATIHYSGRLDAETVKKAIAKDIQFNSQLIAFKSPVYKDRNVVTQNTIFIVNDKKAVQSKIYIFREGNVLNKDQYYLSSAFNSYFGTEMSSIVFQELREKRSYAYSAYSFFDYNLSYPEKPGYLFSHIATQSDKTEEALATFYLLIDSMPIKPERYNIIKTNLLQSLSLKEPDFRRRSELVEKFINAGYKQDMRKDQYNYFSSFTFEDIVDFYRQNVSGKPTIITIYGDTRSFNMNNLSRLGKIVKVNKKDLVKN
ncbi:MAG TPA: insulinase family protein [Bacteroidales bacterium]|nr:insulinase family protein [Bacteroidales bacterium]